jgi:hypothetical protein
MFTLKIRWMRYESEDNGPSVVVDETTLFIAADRIAVHASTTSLDTMKAWGQDEYKNYAVEIENPQDSEHTIMESRLIEVTKDDKVDWYLASHAWIMGPDGSTIERVAP